MRIKQLHYNNYYKLQKGFLAEKLVLIVEIKALWYTNVFD